MYNMSAYEQTEEMGKILFSPLFQYFISESQFFSPAFCISGNIISL